VSSTCAEAAFTIADNKFAIKNLTMEDLALAVTRFADRKTIDATGLTDRFDSRWN
jgi:uncharacterized protein (TIGR03435 family)